MHGQTKDQEKEIEKLYQQIESLNTNHIVELERLTEKKDYEKDKALLDVERDYQQKLLSASEEYNNRFKEMYEEIHSIRKEYEDKIEKLQQAQTKQTTRPINKNQNKS
ncbi:MAG: hypothetical protein WAM95_18230 [Bacillus sp. (in: firmicutes)]